MVTSAAATSVSVKLPAAHSPLCDDMCAPEPIAFTLHAAWDYRLLGKLASTWDALAAQVESGWLSSAEARMPSVDGGSPADLTKPATGWAGGSGSWLTPCSTMPTWSALHLS